MPIVICIALLTACVCNVILTVTVIVVAVGLKARADAMDRSFTQLKGELAQLIQESRGAVVELRQAIARVSGPMEDLKHITSIARAWTDRADRLVDAVAGVAEPPLFFLSKNLKTLSGIMGGVMQVLLTPKR